MRKRWSLVVSLLVGIVIGMGLPARFHVQGVLGDFVFNTALAQAGEGEGEGVFDSLTVDGPTTLNGDVTIGTSEVPVDSVAIYGTNIGTQVSGWGINVYEEGFASYYGDVGSLHGAVLFGTPYFSSSDVTNYVMSLFSTGFFVGKGSSGELAVGSYSASGSGSFEGAYLAANDTSSNILAAAHVKATQDGNNGPFNGEAYLGAMRSDGLQSSIQIDAAGNIVIVLGDGSSPNLQANQQQGGQMMRGQQGQSTAQSLAASSGPSGHGVGGWLPQPDLSYLSSQFGSLQGGQP